MSDFSNLENEKNKEPNGYFESDRGKDIVDGYFIKDKIDKIIKEENKKFSEKKNKIVEEAVIALDGVFSSEPEGKKNENNSDNIKKAEWAPSKELRKDLINSIKEESESDYYSGIKDENFKEANKSQRKLVSFTISLDAKSKLKELSQMHDINKSRLIEKLINIHYEERKKFKETFANSAVPINVDMLELANKVAKIIKSENLT